MDKMAAGGICVSCVLLMAGALTVKGHTPQGEWTNSVTSYNYGAEERTVSDTYTTAYINVTYEDEHGEIYSETLEVGKYGEGFVGSAAGVAKHARAADDPDDHSGCTRPLVSDVPSEPWIAIVRRGKCNFEVKVANAFEANASAILVYNDRDATSLDKMKLFSIPGRNMSAVFTYKWKGEEIARLVDNGTRVYVTISKARNCSRPYNINRLCTTAMLRDRQERHKAPARDASVSTRNLSNGKRASVLFVSISFIVLMIISLAWLVFYYIQRFRYIHAKDRLSKRLCCAAKKALSKIPVKNLKSDDREVQGDGECCAVCIEPYKISDLLRTLPCRHDFHKSCIDPWLLEHRTCPMCKMDILKYYGFVFTGSQESILQLDVEEGRRSRALSPSTRGSHTRQITRENSFTEASSERSSRASSPDELTPSLRTNCGGSPSHAPSPVSEASPTHSHSKETKSREGSPKRDLQQSTNEPMTSNGTTVTVTMPTQD